MYYFCYACYSCSQTATFPGYRCSECNSAFVDQRLDEEPPTFDTRVFPDLRPILHAAGCLPQKLQIYEFAEPAQTHNSNTFDFVRVNTLQQYRSQIQGYFPDMTTPYVRVPLIATLPRRSTQFTLTVQHPPRRYDPDTFLVNFHTIVSENIPSQQQADEVQRRLDAVKTRQFDSTKDESTCSICLEIYTTVVAQTNCDHIFHFDCLKSWLRLKNKCPLCQATVAV